MLQQPPGKNPRGFLTNGIASKPTVEQTRLEDLEVTVSDHLQKVLKPNFAAAWEEVGDDFEKEETFALSSIKTLDEAVNNIIKFLGMQPCERSDKVPENKNSHTLYLA
ncbi:hypothetical protein EK904_008152, partial [Melospiza melodia maxima]